MEDYEKRTYIRLGKGTCDAFCRNEKWWVVDAQARLSMIGRAYEVDLDKYVSPQTEHRACMVRSAVEEKVG